jgi:hypothetical protein
MRRVAKHKDSRRLVGQIAIRLFQEFLPASGGGLLRIERGQVGALQKVLPVDRKQHPNNMRTAEIEAFLTHLV